MPKVELRPAYSWTCPHCGVDQFERSIVAEFSPEEEQEMWDEIGVEPGQGDWITMPETVTCQQCDRDYKTLHFNEDDEE